MPVLLFVNAIALGLHANVMHQNNNNYWYGIIDD
jgi:hypothetical protein